MNITIQLLVESKGRNWLYEVSEIVLYVLKINTSVYAENFQVQKIKMSENTNKY